MTELTCKRCGGTHRPMELCPEAPGFIDYLGGWFSGDRGPMNYLAICGLTLFCALSVLIVIAVSRG